MTVLAMAGTRSLVVLNARFQVQVFTSSGMYFRDRCEAGDRIGLF